MRVMFALLSVLLTVVLAACGSSGAVVFAPTPLPPDTSPLTYTHPSGAFRVQVPRLWALNEQNAQTLASASFSPSGAHSPALRIAVIRAEQMPLNAESINATLDAYQQRIRPDFERYTEQNRAAMGDGSWRLSGLRQLPGGNTQMLNTFIELRQAHIAVLEVQLTDDAALNAALQTAINTFELLPSSALVAAPLDTLAFATSGKLEARNVHTWTTPQGVFFITGEVINLSSTPLSEVSVRAVFYTADNRAVTEATDILMGYSIAPGDFAPFSLRFGQGQPPLTVRYALSIGESATPTPAQDLIPTEALTWTDDISFTEDGLLVIEGTVSNVTAAQYAYLPRVTVTVFDEQQNVVAAAFADLDDVEIAPQETTPYRLVIPDYGGQPNEYIVSVQAKP